MVGWNHSCSGGQPEYDCGGNLAFLLFWRFRSHSCAGHSLCAMSLLMAAQSFGLSVHTEENKGSTKSWNAQKTSRLDKLENAKALAPGPFGFIA